MNEGSSSADATPALPEQCAFNLDAALHRFGGKRALLTRLAQAFVHGYAEAPAKIAAYAEADNFSDLSHVAHSIKGAAGLLDAAPLNASAAALEDALRDGASRARIVALVPPFLRDLHGVLAALQQFAPTEAESGAGARQLDPAGRAHALALLGRLVPLLREGDFAAGVVLDELNEVLDGTPLAAQTVAVRIEFDQLNTDAAASLAQRLRNALAA